MLQTGQEITELDSSGFVTSSPTVFAGNIGEKKYILQVSNNVCLFVRVCVCVCTCVRVSVCVHIMCDDPYSY